MQTGLFLSRELVRRFPASLVVEERKNRFPVDAEVKLGRETPFLFLDDAEFTELRPGALLLRSGQCGLFLDVLLGLVDPFRVRPFVRPVGELLKKQRLVNPAEEARQHWME